MIVHETYAPPGKEPVNWKLFTMHRVNKETDSDKIVTIYKKRWKIEELNKCAKTGVLLELRQFTKIETFIPAVAMIFVVSWKKLYIRDVAKRNDDTPVEEVFNKEEVDYLNNKIIPEDEKTLTVNDALDI